MGDEEVFEVEVGELAEWTSGYSREHAAVALILRTADGEQFGVAMAPREALSMSDQLRRMGLSAIVANN